MAQIWQYTLAVLVTVIVWALLVWAMFGHERHCINDGSPFSHPMIYFPKRRRCFPLYTQGPCREGFWLTIEELKVSCTKNVCIDRFNKTIPIQEQTVVLFNNQCYNLGESCGEDRKIIVYGDSGYPSCTNAMVFIPKVGDPRRSLSCPKGTFEIRGVCRPPDAML